MAKICALYGENLCITSGENLCTLYYRLHADLVVLDDPISSFDEHKKFAIIRRMFDNKKPSLKNRTVLMFTHDLQPIIDYIHGRFFNRFGLTTSVYGSFLQNSNGVIDEKSISSTDLINTVELTKQLAEDPDAELPIRVVNLRKYVELICPEYAETAVYDVLSNIIHGRDIPTDKLGDPFTDEWVTDGMTELNKHISGETYESIINKLSSGNLIQFAETEDNYLKIVAYRLLFERHENMLTFLRKQYPAACKYINETNHVENDYIFQLDPRKYFSIPAAYLDQIQQFVNEHADELRDSISGDLE